MARKVYGGSPGDVVAVVSPDDGDYAPGSGTFNVYNAASGGTQVTDLLTVGGAVITQVTPDADGMVEFQGPDGYASALWIEESAGGRRYRIDPADLASRITSEGEVVTDHGALTGLGDDDHTQYLNNARGDVRYYTKAQTDQRLSRFDVKTTYGAVGNNTADDTAALQAAIDAAEAAGGGVVYFPAGTYKTSATLSIEASNVHLIGDPNAVISYTGSGTAVRYGTKTSGVEINNVLHDVRIAGTSSGAIGLHWIAVRYSRCTPRVSGFSGAGAVGFVLDTQSVSTYVGTNNCVIDGGLISGCTNGIKLTKDAADPNTYGANHNTFYGTRVMQFTGIGVDVDFGENNSFFGVDASTPSNGTTGFRVNDSVCGFFNCRADNSFGVGNTAVGFHITPTGSDYMILNPTGNGPTTRIKYDATNITGVVLRNTMSRIVGGVDFDRAPTVNGAAIGTGSTGATGQPGVTQIKFRQEGEASLAVNLVPEVVPFPFTIEGGIVAVSEAPTGAPIQVDFTQQNNSLWSNPANRPTVPKDQLAGALAIPDSSGPYPAMTRLSMNVTSVGDATSTALTPTIKGYLTGDSAGGSATSFTIPTTGYVAPGGGSVSIAAGDGMVIFLATGQQATLPGGFATALGAEAVATNMRGQMAYRTATGTSADGGTVTLAGTGSPYSYKIALIANPGGTEGAALTAPAAGTSASSSALTTTGTDEMGLWFAGWRSTAGAQPSVIISSGAAPTELADTVTTRTGTNTNFGTVVAYKALPTAGTAAATTYTPSPASSVQWVEGVVAIQSGVGAGSPGENVTGTLWIREYVDTTSGGGE